MPARRKRILVTGGNGFLGAVLTRSLIAEGHEVQLLLRPQSNTWRLSGISGQYAVFHADLRAALAVQKIVAACKPEIVYHLAAHGTFHFQEDRSAILSSNLEGTANLLQALENVDYEALVNVGTSSEYGHKNGAMRET